MLIIISEKFSLARGTKLFLPQNLILVFRLQGRPRSFFFFLKKKESPPQCQRPPLRCASNIRPWAAFSGRHGWIGPYGHRYSLFFFFCCAIGFGCRWLDLAFSQPPPARSSRPQASSGLPPARSGQRMAWSSPAVVRPGWRQSDLIVQEKKTVSSHHRHQGHNAPAMVGRVMGDDTR